MKPGDTVKLKGDGSGQKWCVKRVRSDSTGIWISLRSGVVKLAGEDVWYNSENYEVI